MKVNMWIIASIIVAVVLFRTFQKDTFETIQQQNQIDYDINYRPHVYTNQVTKANPNNDIITKSFLKNLMSEYSNNYNTHGGANITVQQNKYDLIFKDILVSSNKRNTVVYPNPNNYSIQLNTNINQIYKAELIDVNIPAATDDTINIPTNANRLYFSYTDTSYNQVIGYSTIMAGTYLNPATIAEEIGAQMNNILAGLGLKLNKITGVIVNYNKNLNRYIFSDRNHYSSGTLVIYPQNGYVINSSLTVENSIADLLMLNYTNDTITQPYYSGPKSINSIDNVLYVSVAQPGDYGEANGIDVPLNANCMFSNSILSDVVLTECKIFLSLGKLNGDTCTIVPDQSINNIGNVPQVFCQVPNNACVSSSSVKTMLNQPSVYSAIQFYNPPISKLNKFEVKWFTENGNLIRILDHCFTIRVYYFQKRIDTTDFSFPIP